MKKLYDVTAIGEILIDFTDSGTGEYGARLFARNPGGAVANVAAAVSRLGLRGAFIGKVGDDMHGEFLRSALEGAGVDVSGLVTDGGYFTTLAFVKLTETGERSFSFSRQHGADTRLRYEEIPDALLSQTRVLHCGTIAMTDEPERTAQLRAIERAKSCGALLSFDPNYRDTLWRSEAQFKRAVDELLPVADIVKISDEETRLVTGESEPERALEALLGAGASLAAVTLGSRGAVTASAKAGPVYCPGVECRAVDCTGAGDAFLGGLLSACLSSGKAPDDASADDLREWTDFANHVGAFCAAHYGAISGMPTREELGL